MTPTDDLRQALYEFAMTYRIESREARTADLDNIMASIEREKKKAVEEAVPLAINANARYLFNNAVKMEHLIAEVMNIMYGSGTHTDPNATFENTLSPKFP